MTVKDGFAPPNDWSDVRLESRLVIRQRLYRHPTGPLSSPSNRKKGPSNEMAQPPCLHFQRHRHKGN